MTANSNLFIRVVGMLGQGAPARQKIALSNAPVLIGSVGQNDLYGYNIYNPNAVDVFVKFYNKATAPVVGTDIPFWILQVSTLGSVVLIGSDIICRFPLGMHVAAVTGYLDTDTTAPTTPLYALINYNQ